MDIQFDYRGAPVGGQILNYLLEQSRVVSCWRKSRVFVFDIEVLFTKLCFLPIMFFYFKSLNIFPNTVIQKRLNSPSRAFWIFSILRHLRVSSQPCNYQVQQAGGERNFHIFYQLLEGADDNLLERLFLERSPESYYYIAQVSSWFARRCNKLIKKCDENK